MMRPASLAAALLDPDVPAPRHFNVHRNTVVSSLMRALAEGFPSVERLVGPAFFTAMAAVHVRTQPPSHPVLLAYGAGFAGFLEHFEPVAGLPYLADVARLDGLRRRAWHAADVDALDLETLAGGDPSRLATRRVALHPSLGVLASIHPAHTVWAAQNGGASATGIDWTPQTTAVWRQHGAIRAEAVDAPLLDLLRTARQRRTLDALLAATDDARLQARAQAFADASAAGLADLDDAAMLQWLRQK